MDQRPPQPTLDFSDYIAERTKDFSGRTWVFERLDDWLADPGGSRVFLLTGEPGSGKTAVTSRLAQFCEGGVTPPAALSRLAPGFLTFYHFCRTGYPSTLNPLRFVAVLGETLAERFPAFRAALLAQQEQQRHTTINATATVTVNTAGPGATITGQRIVLSLRGLSAREAFDQVVRQPLQEAGIEEPFVVLVDSLDEAATWSGSETLLTLLADDVQDLPPGMRLLLTSRPDVDTLRKLGGAEAVKVTLSPEGRTPVDLKTRQQIREDVERYVTDAVTQVPALAAKLAPDFLLRTFITAIANKSVGNFLYLRYLLAMLAAPAQPAPITAATLKAFPSGLDAIYLEFLERLVGKRKTAWGREYAPLLGVLAVAQAPLTEDQLAVFTKKQAVQVRPVLTKLRQVLDTDDTDEIVPASQRNYTLYHRSFADLLLDRDRAKDYWIDTTAMHRRIVAAYEGKGGDGFEVDWTEESDIVDYGLRHLTSHLYQLRDVAEYLTLLHALLHSDVYIDRRLLVLSNPHPVLDDLRLALDLALRNDDLPRVWTHIEKYRRVLRNERDFERIKQAVKSHHYILALERTALYGYLPKSQTLLRLWIAWVAASNGRGDQATEITTQALKTRRPHSWKSSWPSYSGDEAQDPVEKAIDHLLLRIASHVTSSEWLSKAAKSWQDRVVELQRQLPAPFPARPDQLPEGVIERRLDDVEGHMARDRTNVREIINQYQYGLADGIARSVFSQRWLRSVERAVQLIATDEYLSYRETALSWIASSVVQQPQEQTAQQALQTVLEGALEGVEVVFMEDAAASSLQALMSAKGQKLSLALLQDKMGRLFDQVVLSQSPETNVHPGQDKPRADPWARSMRRLSAIAAALYRDGQHDLAKELLQQASSQHHSLSYAGFRTLARLSLVVHHRGFDE